MEPNEFQGTIGPTWRESTPWWPEPERAPDERTQRRAVRPRRRRLRAARVLRLRHRHPQHQPPRRRRPALPPVPHHRALLPDPRLPAHRPQPPLRRHGSHHRPRPRLPGLLRPHPQVGRLPLRDARASTATRPSPSASGTSRPTTKRTSRRPATRWPLARGFERFYGFFHGETHQYEPDLVHDNHFVEPPRTDGRGLPPHRGPRRPRDRVHHRPARRRTPRSRSSSTSPPARATHRTTRRPSGSTRSTRASSTQGWDVWREPTFARQLGAASSPKAPSRRPRPPWVPAWDDVPDDEKPLAARFMECFAAYLSHTDHHIGRVVDFIDSLGELDNTIIVLVSDNGASSEGGTHGIDQRRAALEPAPRRRPRDGRAHRRARRAARSTTTTRGAGRWPAARRCAAGSARCTRAASPTRASCTARVGINGDTRGQIRGQFTHAIDVAPTILDLIGLESPADDRRRARSVRSTARASRTRSTRPTRPSGTPRSTSRCSARARSTTRAGRPSRSSRSAACTADDDPDKPFEDDVI